MLCARFHSLATAAHSCPFAPLFAQRNKTTRERDTVIKRKREGERGRQSDSCEWESVWWYYFAFLSVIRAEILHRKSDTAAAAVRETMVESLRPRRFYITNVCEADRLGRCAVRADCRLHIYTLIIYTHICTTTPRQWNDRNNTYIMRFLFLSI